MAADRFDAVVDGYKAFGRRLRLPGNCPVVGAQQRAHELVVFTRARGSGERGLEPCRVPLGAVGTPFVGGITFREQPEEGFVAELAELDSRVGEDSIGHIHGR